MESELEYLEGRVGALIERLADMVEQNHRLSAALAEALKDNAELSFTLEQARTRVAAVMDRLPQEASEDEEAQP